MEIKLNLASTISSTSQLQGTCKTLQKRLTAKLKKLEAVQDSAGVKVTEATFDEFTGDVNELNKLVIEEDTNGNDSAFILTVFTKVKIS